MKRVLSIALAGLLAVTGCQREKPSVFPEGEPVDVSFRVGVAGATKAIGDGTGALRLTLRIYDANHAFLQECTADKTANESSWTINVSILPDLVYDFCFWAASPESEAYGFDGQYLTVDYSKISPNSDRGDAFWGVKSFKVEGAFTESITLNRPLALLALYSKDDTIDLGQEDLNDATKFVSGLTLKGGVPTRLNLQSGEADQPQEEVTFAEAPLTALETDQTYGTVLAYSYVLAPAGGLTLNEVDYSATLKRATPEKDLASGTAKDVPLERNRRTLLVTGGGVQLGSVTITGWAGQGAVIEGEALEEIKDLSKFMEDDVFRAFCLANYDANHDGLIVEEEVAGVTTMDVSGKGIKSLAGIEYFTNLTTLDCHDNDLDYLDVSKNTKLKNLDGRNNYFECIYIKKGQTFERLQTFRKFASSPINIKVNGKETVLIGAGETLVFTATLSDGITANSLTWCYDFTFGQRTVSHLLQGNTDQFEQTYDQIKDEATPGNLYEMYAETPDGIRTNSVGFGICGDNPLVCFDNVYQSCYLNVNEEKYLHVKSYPGKQSTYLVLKYQLRGEGCNLSSIPEDTEEFIVHWSKPGDKQITVTVTDQQGKTGTSTFVVHVVEVTLIEL